MLTFLIPLDSTELSARKGSMDSAFALSILIENRDRFSFSRLGTSALPFGRRNAQKPLSWQGPLLRDEFELKLDESVSTLGSSKRSV